MAADAQPCPTCHLPLVHGRERHYERHYWDDGEDYLAQVLVPHRCTGLDLPVGAPVGYTAAGRVLVPLDVDLRESGRGASTTPARPPLVEVRE